MEVHIPAFDDPEMFKTVLNAGSEFYFESLQELVRRLTTQLGEEEHIEIIHHQTGKPISLRTVEYPGSQEIILGGTTADGSEVRVFAHVAGLQLEVKVVTHTASDAKHREIGFQAWQKSGGGEEDG
jgi:hypothetical protein